MTQNLENKKINAAVDMLIESDSDLSNILGREGLMSMSIKNVPVICTKSVPLIIKKFYVIFPPCF